VIGCWKIRQDERILQTAADRPITACGRSRTRMVLAARIHAAEIESIGGFRCTTFLDTTGRVARRDPTVMNPPSPPNRTEINRRFHFKAGQRALQEKVKPITCGRPNVRPLDGNSFVRRISRTPLRTARRRAGLPSRGIDPGWTPQFSCAVDACVGFSQLLRAHVRGP